jgi:hypothetical protein
MAVDPARIEEIVRAAIDLYRAAEAQILALVTRYLEQGIDAPTWAADRLAALARMRRAAQDILRRLADDASGAVAEAVAAGYRAGGQGAVAEAVAAGLTVPGVPLALRVAPVESLAAALIQDIGERHSNVLRHVEDVYRRVIAEASAVSVAGGRTRREASQYAYQRFVDQGVTSFTDVSGRRWRLSSYVEMGVRTVTQRAAVQGQTDRLESIGQDLVIVSDEVQECVRCRPYEGEVLRISPGPTGELQLAHATTGQPVTVTVKATLLAARAAGLQHPNCRHVIRLYLPGVTRRPEKPTADPEGDKARQRQREIERAIRRWKEREAAALDPDAKKAARAKVRAWQATMRDHLADWPALRRLPYREQVGAGNVPR